MVDQTETGTGSVTFMPVSASGESINYNDKGGFNDPGTGQGGGTPSEKTAGKGKPAPKPYKLPKPGVPFVGGPVMANPVVTDQLHLGGWKLYFKDQKMYASNGLHDLQFVMINPGGLTQSSNPNTSSDGSDKSTKASAGNTATSGRTVPQINTGATSNAGTTPAGNSAGVPSGNNVDNILRTLRYRESRNNYTAQATTSSASGAYQFINETWQNVSAQAGYAGAYKRAKDAPPAVQDAVARYYVNSILTRSGGDLNAVPNIWFTGNINGNMSAAQRAANPTVTSAIYRNNFWSTFNSLNGSNNTALAYTNANTPSNVPAAFANMSPGQGFPSAASSNINTAASNSGGSASPTDQLASNGQQALGQAGDQTLATVPCIPNEIQQALSQLTPGGLTELVLNLTDATKELSKITKQIADLLPGVPFSITGQIMKMLTEGFSTLNDNIGLIDKELTGGLNKIMADLNCITQDLNAVSSGINNVINSYTNLDFINALPPNLSLDDFIDGKANSALNNLQVSPQSLTAGAPLQLPGAILAGQSDAVVASLNEEVIEVEPEIRTVKEDISIADPEDITFVATVDTGRPVVEELLGRPITNEEWTNLIASAYDFCSEDIKEVAWYIRTVINRCVKTGGSITEVVDEFIPVGDRTQKFIYGPMNDHETSINQIILQFVSSVPANNYYIDSFRDDIISKSTYHASRKGVPGIAVGQSFVYPGAKWP